MVLQQAERVRKIVEDGLYDKCPVKGEKEVQLFLVDGMTAILRQAKQNNIWAAVSGGSMAGAIIGLFKMVEMLFGN